MSIYKQNIEDKRIYAKVYMWAETDTWNEMNWDASRDRSAQWDEAWSATSMKMTVAGDRDSCVLLFRAYEWKIHWFLSFDNSKLLTPHVIYHVPYV